MEIAVFADERKNIQDRWDYIAIVFVPLNHSISIFRDLISSRDKVNYHHTLKFSTLNKSGTGSKFALACEWIDKVINNAKCDSCRIYFKVFGIDKDKIDFSFFGNSSSPSSKYSNVYNRFFRSTLLSALNYYFPKIPLTIKNIYHDTEGNLQNHNYFEWNCIKKISEREKRISFKCDKVLFVNSNHKKELVHPNASHLIQLTDLLIGAVTYCIHETNLKNLSQFRVASRLLPLVRGILNDPYNKLNPLGYYKRYDICHFPKDHIRTFHEERILGEFYRMDCNSFWNRITGQQEFDFCE